MEAASHVCRRGTNAGVPPVDHRLSLAVHEDIRWVEIAMKESTAVGKRVQNLESPSSLPITESRCPRDSGAKRASRILEIGDLDLENPGVGSGHELCPMVSAAGAVEDQVEQRLPEHAIEDDPWPSADRNLAVDTGRRCPGFHRRSVGRTLHIQELRVELRAQQLHDFVGAVFVYLGRATLTEEPAVAHRQRNATVNPPTMKQ